MIEQKPKVAILMATFNGMSWLQEQVDSILNQSNVGIRLYVSDDASNDGTADYLENLTRFDERVSLLPQDKHFGSAGKNFYRLIIDTDISGFDYVAYSDQDDIWTRDKLIRQIELSRTYKADGVSSDVIAFWPDGKYRRIVKSQPLRQFDYLFESAGPGCTFLMTPWLLLQLREILVAEDSIAKEVTLHDWLTYAVCIASGKRWHIDNVATVQYRQHSANVIGANKNLKAKISRIKKLADGWYRAEVLKVTRICYGISGNNQLLGLIRCLQSPKYTSCFPLLIFAVEARRRFRDRLFLMLSIVLFLF